MFLTTVGPDEATGEIAEIYAAEMASRGRVMEATACWSARPDILVPVETLLHQLRDGFSLGLLDFRLITFVVARRVPSAYCSQVYFGALSSMMGRDAALAVLRDWRAAGLSSAQVAMLDYADRIAVDASQITQPDIDALREHGFSDLNIADIALAASFRCFLSRYFDAVGATAEPEFVDPDPEVRAILTGDAGGRPR